MKRLLRLLMLMPVAAWAVTPACEFLTNPAPGTNCVELCTPDRVPTVLGMAIDETTTHSCSDTAHTTQAACTSNGTCTKNSDGLTAHKYVTEATCLPDDIHCAETMTPASGLPTGKVAAIAAQTQDTGTVTRTQAPTGSKKRQGAAKVEIWVDDVLTTEYEPPQ